jgi:site-specific DNA recombinase
MTEVAPQLRCAIYTRKSTEDGLEQDFNSLHAQQEAAEAYIRSQALSGWTTIKQQYSDGGFSGANLDRPGLKLLLSDIESGAVDCVVVYKVDRLSRSLLDFARLVALFDRHGVNFVSITQALDTTTSLGRLTLNILLSFAHYAECGIMRSYVAEVTVWLAFQ